MTVVIPLGRPEGRQRGFTYGAADVKIVFT